MCFMLRSKNNMVILLKDTLVNHKIIIWCIKCFAKSFGVEDEAPEGMSFTETIQTELFHISGRTFLDDRGEERWNGTEEKGQERGWEPHRRRLMAAQGTLGPVCDVSYWSFHCFSHCPIIPSFYVNFQSCLLLTGKPRWTCTSVCKSRERTCGARLGRRGGNTACWEARSASSVDSAVGTGRRRGRGSGGPQFLTCFLCSPSWWGERDLLNTEMKVISLTEYVHCQLS